MNTTVVEPRRMAVEQLIRYRFLEPVVVNDMRVRRSEYSSSYAIDEVDVYLDDGRVLELMAKHRMPGALLHGARVARRGRRRDDPDPVREALVYERLLPHAPPGPPVCFGATSEWLLLERVDGLQLCHVGDFAVWSAAAEWLRAMHGTFLRPGAERCELFASKLPRWERRHLEAAVGVAVDRHPEFADAAARAIGLLLTTPSTLVHGDCFASNIVVANGRVAFLDWEGAAIGSPLLDCAALVAGSWSEPQRWALVTQYLGRAPDKEDRARFLAARFHLALRQLSRPTAFEPPSHHAFEWLDEARRVAEEVVAG